MRRWQLSALALGTPAKRTKPLSAAVASVALPNRDFPRRCNCIHPPWAPSLCWLGLFASYIQNPKPEEMSRCPIARKTGLCRTLRNNRWRNLGERRAEETRERKKPQCLRHRASSHIQDCGIYWVALSRQYLS